MNVGLIGYGFMGAAHLAALAGVREATLTAVACRVRPSGEGAVRGNLDLKAGPLPATVAWHPDWRTIVDDPTIDAVDICLPTPLHKEVALRALARGKHVLCEKPMALTVEDCDEMLEAAAKAGRVLMVAQVLRFMPAYRYGARFAARASGPMRCTLRRLTGFPQWSDWLADPARSGGAILDLLSHDLDQALQWFGAPEAVSAVSLGEVDTARVTLRYAHGATVTVEGGWLSSGAPFAQSFALEGVEGMLAFAEGRLRLTRDGAVDEIALSDEDAYAAEMSYFIECCRSGATPALCAPEESARAVRLAGLARRSREDGGKEVAWT